MAEAVIEYLEQAGKDLCWERFRGGAVLPFERVWISFAMHDCALVISPVTSYPGVKNIFTWNLSLIHI